MMGEKKKLTAAEQVVIETAKRLKTEIDELNTRLGKLQAFISGGNPAWTGLTDAARARLEHQHYLMGELYRVLRLRLKKDFPPIPKE